ncbi:hypothetical protein DICVIV_03116 [Dictyocaulus viviparus]|uniref:Protein furry C-terminal domain-containing protein n=1 Tax=Dictyocaulus viviparus TaxID=29172 RepID=A0A0D8Y456_DICVI|nr:hypothetical protein DICVIV_03116 [Dictyocaulus viviparus]
MLSQYSTKSFSKDRYQWAKCVLQYLCEAIDATVIQQIIVFLAEGANWREAARVYKVVVEQWQNSEKDNKSEDSSSGLEFNHLISLASGSCRPCSPSLKQNLATVDSTGSNAVGTFKKQAPPHIRVRDRLVGLLSASGLRVGLPTAVSVVFSQSDLVSATSSNEGICLSSQEVASTTSLPDPSASITDSFPRVFKEFDFLEVEHDSVSETADSCFGWLSTMRPRSIVSDENAQDDDADVDDDEKLCRIPKVPRLQKGERHPPPVFHGILPLQTELLVLQKLMKTKMAKVDDRFGSTSLPIVQAQSSLTPQSTVSRDVHEKRQVSHLNEADEGSIDGSSFCCHSHASVGEFYSPKATLTFPVYIKCSHHFDGKVDSTWISIVSELQDDLEGELTAYATLLFTQLFRTCCGRVTSLFRDAVHTLSSRSLTRAFAHAQEVLTGVADCPFLFVTAQYLRCAGILSRLKLSLFELREHWETFNERKEQSIRLLSSVKSAHKLNALVGSTSLTVNSELELGKVFSKLLFQLMLMSDSLNDMVRLVSESHGSQTYTLSPAVLDHQRELLVCITDLPQCEIQSPTLAEHSGDSLVLLMTNKRYVQALHTLRQLRTMFGQEFGCCEASDIDVLLLLFCRSHLLKAWALVGSRHDVLRQQSQCLRDANADVASVVRRLTSDSSMHRTATSSLTESFQKISYLPD